MNLIPLLALLVVVNTAVWLVWMSSRFSTSVVNDVLDARYDTSHSAHSGRSNPYEWIKNETLFQQWVANEYHAPNKDKDEYCKNILQSRSGSAAQFGQDLTIYFTLFQQWSVEGRKGFYVDSGANHATQISNTVFFDWCLGWNGLCVEPDPQYHEEILKHRSCTLLPECITDKDQVLKFNFNGALGHVDTSSSSDTGTSVKCSSLESMLQRVNVTDNIIDFWSLDVEGHEMTVLKTIDFDKIHVGVLLIEDFWIPTRELDQLMYDSNFVKLYELPIDALYVNRSLLLSKNTNKVWLPPSYRQDVIDNLNYRAHNKNNIQCF